MALMNIFIFFFLNGSYTKTTILLYEPWIVLVMTGRRRDKGLAFYHRYYALVYNWYSTGNCVVSEQPIATQYVSNKLAYHATIVGLVHNHIKTRETWYR